MACVVKRRDRWVIDFYDQTGKRRWVTLPKEATKGQAKEALRDIEDRVRGGGYVSPRKTPTFKEVAESWLEHKKAFLRESTWGVYGINTRLHFKRLEPLKIDQVDPPTIERWIAKHQAQGMHINTLRKQIVILGQILKYAVRHRHIQFNPLGNVERPREQGQEGEPRAEKTHVLTPEEIGRFLEAEPEQKYRTLFMVAIFSGAREDELFGGKWEDVLWDQCQIQIRRTFNHGRFYSPKTKAAYRKIDLGPVVMSELKKWWLACPKGGTDLVFPNDQGEPLDYHNMKRRHFFPALERAGLPQIRFHDLRHTTASLLIAQGESLKYIQTQLGHSRPSITLDVYSHLIGVEGGQEAAKRLEETVFNGTGSKMVAEKEKGAKLYRITP